MARFKTLLAAVAALLTFAPSALAVQPGVVPRGDLTQEAEAKLIDEVLGTAPVNGRWIRIMESWPLLQPEGPRFGDELRNLDNRVRLAAASGNNVLLMVTGAPDWAHPGKSGSNHPPTDSGDYARMMSDLAERYAGTVQALEVWNEPDDDDYPGDFWRGPPDPAAYTALLKATYSTVKADAALGGYAAPAIITGGMVGNNYDFLEGMYKAGAKGYFDAVGVHTDTACLLRDPGFYYREPNGRIGRYAFSGYRELRQLTIEQGDPKPIWFTEIGWSSTTEPCDSGNDKGKKPGGVGEAEQAKMVGMAYDCLANDDYAQVALWFSLQDFGTDARRHAYRFGLTSFDGKRKPAFSAFQDVFRRGLKPTFCGAKVDRDAPQVTIRTPSQYFYRLVTSGEATDATTPVTSIELWANGKRIMKQKGAKFSYDWFGSSRLPYGTHKIQLRAYDEAGNVGIAEAPTVRGRPNGPRNVTAQLGFSVKRSGRKFRIRGSVSPPADGSFAEPAYGRLNIRIRWGNKKPSTIPKGIGSRKVAYTYTARRKGKLRIYAELAANAPYKKTRTKVFTFRVK